MKMKKLSLLLGSVVLATACSTKKEPAPVEEAPAPAPVEKPAPVKKTVSKVNYSAESLFDFDKSVLKDEGKESLNKLVNDLKGTQIEMVLAVGHTDSVGNDEYNYKLSENRAQAVKEYLVANGISENSIEIEGKGKDEPVADNKTREGRAANRRVVVTVVGNK